MLATLYPKLKEGRYLERCDLSVLDIAAAGVLLD